MKTTSKMILVLAMIAVIFVAGCAGAKKETPKTSVEATKEVTLGETEGAKKASSEKTFGKDVPDSPADLRNLSMPSAPKPPP